MVQADEKTIQAIINTVKKLPVECKSFEVADSWVGIVLELEKISDSVILPKADDVSKRIPPKQVDIKYAPPEDIVSEGVNDG